MFTDHRHAMPFRTALFERAQVQEIGLPVIGARAVGYAICPCHQVERKGPSDPMLRTRT